jgi:predicted metal-binding protein
MDEASKVHSEAEEALLAHIAPWAGQFELLGAGSCSLCEECTYPDAPCRFPEQARRSMEACGIDVVTLSKENNIRYFNGANTVTYFSVLLY